MKKEKKFYVALVSMVGADLPNNYLLEDGSFLNSRVKMENWDLDHLRLMKFDTPNDAMNYLEKNFSKLLEIKRAVILREYSYDDIVPIHEDNDGNVVELQEEIYE